jgi:hypothetical protein
MDGAKHSTVFRVPSFARFLPQPKWQPLYSTAIHTIDTAVTNQAFEKVIDKRVWNMDG